MIENFDSDNFSKRSIPDNWSVVRFGDAFEILKSGNNPRSDLNNEGEYKYIHYGDIHKKWKGFLNCEKEFIPRIAEEKVSNLPHLQDGDLIIADASEDYEGLGVATEVINVGNQNIVAGLHTILARGNKDIIADGFKGYIQELRDFKNKLINISTGTTVYGISKTKLADIQIFIPPLIEQIAIAEVLSDVDALIEAQEALIEKKRLIKQGVMQELLTGKRRLPGFSGEWETYEFDQVMMKLETNKNQIKTNEYLQSGKYPVVDQGKNTICAFSNRVDKVFNCPREGVIVFGDHTRIIKFIDFNFVIGADGTQILISKDEISTKFIYYALLVREIPNTGYNRHFKFLREISFKIPKLDEQITISALLSDFDYELVILEEELNKVKLIKEGMIQELLTGRTRLL